LNENYSDLDKEAWEYQASLYESLTVPQKIIGRHCKDKKAGIGSIEELTSGIIFI